MLRLLTIVVLLTYAQLSYALNLSNHYFIWNNDADQYLKQRYVNSLDNTIYDPDITMVCDRSFIIFPDDLKRINPTNIECATQVIFIDINNEGVGRLLHNNKIIRFIPSRDVTDENINFSNYLMKDNAYEGILVQMENHTDYISSLRMLKTNSEDLVNDIYKQYQRNEFAYAVVPYDCSHMVTSRNIRSFLITLSRFNVPVTGGADERYIKSGFMAGAYVDHSYILEQLSSELGLTEKKYLVPFVYIINKFVSKRFRINTQEYKGQKVVFQ